MICEKCRIIYSNIVPESLKLKNSYNCTYCTRFSNIVEEICIEAKVKYQNDLMNWLYLNSPVKNGDHIVIANHRDFDFPRYDGEALISEIVLHLGIETIEYKTKEDKYNIMNQILGRMYDHLFEKAGSNITATLIALLGSLEFNRFISISVINWLRSTSKEEKGQDSFVNLVIDTFNMVKAFEHLQTKNFVRSFNIDLLYFDFENLISLDKNSLEYGIEIIYNMVQKNENALLDSGDYRFGEVMQAIRAITIMRTLKIQFTEGECKEKSLIFDSKGYINEGVVYRNLEENYVQDMVKQEPIFQIEKYEEPIGTIIKEYLGFALWTIDKIVANSFEVYTIGDDFITGDRLSWCRILEKLGECSSIEAEQIFRYLLFDVNEANLFDDKSRKANRIMRKPIVVIDNIYLCVVNSLIFALMGLKQDIYFGDIEEGILKRKLSKIYEEIDIGFENSVYEKVASAFGTAHLRKNINENDIFKNTSKSSFPGQIDILFSVGNIIFVIECKNYNLKIDSKSVANEYGRLAKYNNKSIQGKLDKKVTWVEINMDKVLQYLLINNDKCIDYKTIGVIATSTFSIASQNTNLKYPVVTWTRLCEWLKREANDMA